MKSRLAEQLKADNTVNSNARLFPHESVTGDDRAAHWVAVVDVALGELKKLAEEPGSKVSLVKIIFAAFRLKFGRQR